MLQYLFLLSLLVLSSKSDGNPLTNEVISDQELKFALVIHRHGERAPDEEELSLSDEQELIKNLTYIEGPEGLTNVGKRRAYQIGKYIRQRYGSQGNNLISDIYYQNEISLRSTDKERTKMTIQVAMAAVYPPKAEQQWDDGVGKVWQPVPYSSVPLSEDYLRYYSNCHRFKELMTQAQEQALREEFAAYEDLVPFLVLKTGKNFTDNPLYYQMLFDLFRSSIGLGLDIPEWSKPLLARLSEAARLAYRMYFRDDEMKKIGGGVLLHKFISMSKDIISNKPVPQRLHIFSAHDFNIGALMEVAQVKCDHSIPEYGAVFSLELYRSRSTGSYSVVPVYLPQAGESSAQMLRIIGCESSPYCDFHKFHQNSKDFILPERDYYQTCNIKTEL